MAGAGRLTQNDVTLPSILKQAGYQTIFAGKAHFAPIGHEGEDPTKLGFDINIAGCSFGRPGSYYGEDGYGKLNPKQKKRAVPGLENTTRQTPSYPKRSLLRRSTPSTNPWIRRSRSFSTCPPMRCIHPSNLIHDLQITTRTRANRRVHRHMQP